MNNSSRNRWLAINFAATIFVSAFLLFQVQPLVSKYILPWFGGTAAVWTTCMLFFQTLLFCGYAYAHLSERWLAPRMQGLVHLALIVLAIALLRVVPSDAWKPEDSYNPAWKILGLLTASIGLPYFVLSSTGPLMQAWFARSFPGRTPYRLYALSNIGSLLALLSYPFWFERRFVLRDQATIWSWGFVMYAALAGYAAVSLWMMFRGGRIQGPGVGGQETMASRDREGAEEQAVQTQASAPHWFHYALWLILPAIASVALLATTNHVSIDVTPMPFLWVVPLSLYLVTFIIAFDHPRWYLPMAVGVFTLILIYTVGMVYSQDQSKIDTDKTGIPGKIVYQSVKAINAIQKWRGVSEDDLVNPQRPHIGFLTYAGLNFAALFGICLICHGELVRLRPHPKYLTSFYLLIAAGGAIGGVLVTLVAPVVFVTYFEWNLSLFIGYLLAAAVVVRSLWFFSEWICRRIPPDNLLWIVPALLVPTFFVSGLGAHDLTKYLKKSDEGIRLRVRGFFGTLAVAEIDADDPEERVRKLYHGRITHGVQFTDPEMREQPTSYYARESGIGRTLAFYHASDKLSGVRIGTVGLGTGTMAVFVRDKGDPNAAGKNDSIHFYEINPKVIEISEPGQWFTYLQDAKKRGGDYKITLGDARLSLEREAKDGDFQKFHVLVLDAFSGDAIPMHLLTEQAFETYLKHIATADDGGEAGAIAVHITNRFLDLEPVVLGLANRFQLGHVYISNLDDGEAMYDSDWIILSHNQELLKELEPYSVQPPENRDPPEQPKKPILWTDGQSNLFDVLK